MTWETQNALKPPPKKTNTFRKFLLCHFLFYPLSLTCRASNRTGEGSKAALPPCPAPSLSDWSSLGWVTSDTHSCSSHGGELSSSAGVRETLGECVHELLWDGVAGVWQGEDTSSLCRQLRAESCGVKEPALLLLLSGCRRRSCISGRGAWVVTRAP